jgi:hypothetical protein
MTYLLRPMANKDKLRQSLSFFGKQRQKSAGLTEIAKE